jgi:hypothetical protein
MRNHFSLSAWIGRSAGVLVLLPSLALAGQGQDLTPTQVMGQARNQTRSAPISKNYTNHNVFHLPINIEEKDRAGIREVQLYVKVPGGDWLRTQTAPPSQRSFEYKALADGEYWFTLVTTDARGLPTPNDISRLAPEDILVVVIDTQPPTFELQTIKQANGELLLRCTVFDANSDPKTTKITFRSADQAVHVLEPLPGQAGMYRLPGPEAFLVPVLVSVSDLAHNSIVKEVNLQEVPAIVQPGSAAVPAKQAVESVKYSPPSGGTLEIANASTPPSSNQGQAKAAPPPPFIPPAAPAPVQSTNLDPRPAPVQSTSLDSRPAPAPSAASTSSTPSSLPASGNRQLLNTTRAALDYRIDQVGPSGVGKVEVWMTADQGHSWQRLCEDHDRRSPTEFDLPGDGLFGLRVVVTNGNGFGGRPPQAGDQPHCWIEVDTVAPIVQLRDIEPVTNGNSIDIRWTASDKNLGPEPVNLFYATRKEGPWQPMATRVKNDGLYRWAFPRDVGGQFYVRAEVTDLAGNVSRSESPSAVVLDMTEPRASVVGVSAVHGAGAQGYGGN